MTHLREASGHRLLASTLTDCESLLLSLDLFFASLFFFLWRGRDSRIISSSSNVGSQCRRPFCRRERTNRIREELHCCHKRPWQPCEAVLLLPTDIRNKSSFHLLLVDAVPVDFSEVGRSLHVRQAGEAMFWVHCQKLEGRNTHTHTPHLHVHLCLVPL